ADTNRTLDRAMQELRHQYHLRRPPEPDWTDLPPAIQDGTLRAVTEAVLSSYPGVEGGFWASGQFLGYSYPTHDSGSLKVDVPPAERPEIEKVIENGIAHGASRRLLRGRHDLVIVSAVAIGPTAAWTMKRLPGQAEPARRTAGMLAIALVVIALLG